MDSVSPASFSAADTSFIKGLQDTIDRDIASGREYGGLLVTISRRLESCHSTSTEKRLSWGPIICGTDARSPENDQILVRITGPLPDDHFEVSTTSEQDTSAVVRYVSALSAACQRLEEIRNRLIAVNQKQEELEQERMSLSQSAEVTVEEHIQLLRQYNKTKDVGQQLIGLIAESRGVALGTVYQDAEYGVSADD